MFFKVLTNDDPFGNKGNRIGLSTVKILIEGLGRKITVASEVNRGTKFSFVLHKTKFLLI